MPNYICVTCGVQYPESPAPPAACPICRDPRQFIGLEGQKWTTGEEMRATYLNEIKEEEPGLYSILPSPSASARSCYGPQKATCCGIA